MHIYVVVTIIRRREELVLAVMFPKTEMKVPIDFGSSLLETFMMYVFCINIEPIYFERLYDLFKRVDPKVYKDSQDNQTMFYLIKKVLEGRIEKKITNPVVLAAYAGRDDIKDIVRDGDLLDQGSIAWCNTVIASYIKSQEIYKVIPQLKSLIESIEQSKENPMENIKRFEQLTQMATKAQESINVVNLENDFFSLQDGVFERNINEAYDRLKNPANRLITGMQGMNELLGGGVELSRHYMFFGLPGEGKSGLLLNLVNQIRLCNPRYKGKEPNKIPTIVYLSQENSKVETEERLFNISGCPGNMTDYPVDQVIQMMRDQGHMYLDEDININLVIRYVDPFMISTSYFRDLYCEMSERGMEVILIAHDYVQKIHSEDENVRRDMRLELAQIVAEECSFAKSFDVGFITVAQLNRDASTKVDSGKSANSVNILYNLSRQNIAESMAMINHTDGAYIILNEYSFEEQRNYLGIQKIKLRNKVKDDIKIVYLPCARDCRIRLLMDINKAPIYRTTLMAVPNNTEKKEPTEVKGLSGVDSIIDRKIKSQVSITQGNSAIQSILNKQQPRRVVQAPMPPPKPRQLIPPPYRIIINNSPPQPQPRVLVPPPYKIIIR